MGQLQPEQLEKLISLIDGVISSKVVLGDNGEIAEIHILSTTARSPKQIVRDLETAAMIQLALSIDHKKVSVAQMHSDAPALEGKRLLFKGISYSVSHQRAEVAVTLAFGERQEEGRASGAKTQGNQLRLLAGATLEAVGKLLNQTELFVLEQASLYPFAGREVALVAAIMLGQGAEEPLVGSAFVRGDQREAIVRATLDAINRKSFLMLNS